MRWFILAVLLLIPTPSFGVTLCLPSYDSSGTSKWAYRIVDGRKCWYRLNPRESVGEREKSELHWQTDPPRELPEVPPSEQRTYRLIISPVYEDDEPGAFDARWDEMLHDLGIKK